MAAGPQRAAEPGVASPGSLIITFAGLHLPNLGGWIAVADLITLMEAAGQPSSAIRQALARMKSRGYLAAERRAGRAGYRLTEIATKDLRVGDGRIFRFGEANESDGWVLAIFSVPEHARAERHRLRSQLIRISFGTVSAGVWIAPAALADPSRTHILAHGLDGYVTWFVGRLHAPVQPEQWWDLDSLRALYQEFLRSDVRRFRLIHRALNSPDRQAAAPRPRRRGVVHIDHVSGVTMAVPGNRGAQGGPRWRACRPLALNNSHPARRRSDVPAINP